MSKTFLFFELPPDGTGYVGGSVGGAVGFRLSRNPETQSEHETRDDFSSADGPFERQMEPAFRVQPTQPGVS